MKDHYPMLGGCTAGILSAATAGPFVIDWIALVAFLGKAIAGALIGLGMEYMKVRVQARAKRKRGVKP